MKLNRDLLAKAAGPICISDEEFARLEQFAMRVSEANFKINLVSRGSEVGAEIERQIVLSLALLRIVQIESIISWIDVGSGGGFPALPLAIMRPNVDFTLVEPVPKKAYFLERTAQQLGLLNISVAVEAVETLISRHSTKFDAASIKAVGEWSDTTKWAGSLLNSGGTYITYKPSRPDSAVKALLSQHGFELTMVENIKEVVDIDDLFIVVCKKT